MNNMIPAKWVNELETQTVHMFSGESENGFVRCKLLDGTPIMIPEENLVPMDEWNERHEQQD